MPWKLKKTILSQSFRPWSSPVVGLVLLLSLGFSLLEWSRSELATKLTASREQVFNLHEYYRVFTTIGVHGDLKHYLSNSIFFYIFGFLLHSYFGWFWFPFLSLVLGGFVNYLTLAWYPEHSVLVGASGVVYFMVGAWVTLFFFIERKMKMIKRAMAAIGVSLVLFFPTEFEPQVSYLAHGIGFLMGAMVGMAYFTLNRWRIQKKEVWIFLEPEEALEEPST